MSILFFFSYVTLVFFNIKCISYRVAMTTSVLASSRHLTYHMAYEDSMCLRIHNYYVYFDLSHHFTLNIRCSLYWWSRLLSILTPCRLLFLWMTMSEYDFSFQYFYPLSLRRTLSLIFCTQPHPHFHYTHWLRAVPFVGQLCVSIP